MNSNQEEILKNEEYLTKLYQDLNTLENEYTSLGEEYNKLKLEDRLTENIKKNIAQKRMFIKIQQKSKQKSIKNLTKSINILKRNVNNQPTDLNQEENKSEEELELELELDRILEEENRKKEEQQHQNLAEREQIYERKTGKKYNPLVSDDVETNTDNVGLLNNSPVLEQPSSSEIIPINSATIKSKSSTTKKKKTNKISNKKKTKKNRSTPDGIELQDLSTKPSAPEYVDNTKLLGFRETLVQQPFVETNDNSTNKDICENIFINSSKINSRYFFPSEFPKITKIKPITFSKKGGKRKNKTRKFVK